MIMILYPLKCAASRWVTHNTPPISKLTTPLRRPSPKAPQEKNPKALDMRFYWLQDRKTQGQFNIFWRPEKDNLGDYQTNNCSPSHRRLMRSKFLHTDRLINNLKCIFCKGCVKYHLNARACTHNTRPYKTRPYPIFSDLSLRTLKLRALI